MDEQARATLHLALTDGVGGATFRALVEHFGSAAAALGATEREICELRGFGAKRAAAIARGRTGADVDAELARAAEAGVRLVPWGDAEYPIPLTYLPNPPPVPYVRGQLLPEDARAVAIVGSRRSSLYGQEQSERFAAGLARAGFTVVSGLARGIDACAHVGALKAGGRTLAVLGNGLSRVYPPEHTKRAAEIAEHGAVISELPMAAGPAAENFPRRNRIISGLSLGVLVVEAGKRSGSLITAHLAAEQGKEVFALPGRVDTPFTAGTHRLIQDGAKLVHSLEDILDEFQGLAAPAAVAASKEGDAAAVQETLALGPRLSPAEEAILGALDSEPMTADQIADRANLPASAVAAQLTMLELKRLVRSLPGQRYVRLGQTGK